MCFSGAAEEESWFRLLMVFFGTDTNVFPDPADGVDDGVWIVHIFVVGGHWMDGWEGSAGRERERVREKEREKRKRERERKVN